MTRVLCICGSPRRDGNSARLLDALEAGARSAGATTERVDVADVAIEPCSACGGCSETGVCVLEDGMGEIGRLLDSADAVAVATPIYFASVPAQLKALLDRLQPYWVRRYVLDEPVVRARPGALIVVGGGGDPYGSACAVAPVKSALSVAGFRVSEIVEVTGVDAKGEVLDRPEELERARALGALLAGRACERT